MPRAALRVKVSKKDQAALKRVLGGGIQQVRVAMRAVALLRLAEGMGAPQIAEVLPMTRHRCATSPGAISKAGSNVRCTTSSGPVRHACFRTRNASASLPWSAAIRREAAAPAGRCGWWRKKPSSDGCSARGPRRPSASCFSSHDLKPWREKMWCVAELTDEYIARMEDGAGNIREAL